MAYNFYHAVRLTGTKMENLQPDEFVPKWQIQQEEGDEEPDMPVAEEKQGLANKILTVFGFKK